MTPTLTSLIIAPALAWVVISDLLYRRIANRLVLVLLLLWIVLAGNAVLMAGEAVMPLIHSVLIAAGVLVAGYVLFVLRWMGAGDAKLMAVLCLWLGDQAFAFLIVTALAGGVLALGLPLLHMVEKALAFAILQVNLWLPRLAIPVPQVLSGSPATGIPYGLAIASGAALVLWIGT